MTLEKARQTKSHQASRLEEKLRKYIPSAARVGGACIGLLTVTADLLGAVGSGTGILLAVTMIYGYYETFAKENADILMKGQQ